MRTCRFCRAEYCVIDNEGSSDAEVCRFSVFWSRVACVTIFPILVDWMDVDFCSPCLVRLV
jgi:hypothetical protein